MGQLLYGLKEVVSGLDVLAAVYQKEDHCLSLGGFFAESFELWQEVIEDLLQWDLSEFEVLKAQAPVLTFLSVSLS